MKEEMQSQKQSSGGIMKNPAMSSHSMAPGSNKKSSQVGFTPSVKSSSMRAGSGLPAAGQLTPTYRTLENQTIYKSVLLFPYFHSSLLPPKR